MTTSISDRPRRATATKPQQRCSCRPGQKCFGVGAKRMCAINGYRSPHRHCQLMVMVDPVTRDTRSHAASPGDVHILLENMHANPEAVAESISAIASVLGEMGVTGFDASDPVQILTTALETMGVADRTAQSAMSARISKLETSTTPAARPQSKRQAFIRQAEAEFYTGNHGAGTTESQYYVASALQIAKMRELTPDERKALVHG